MDGLKGFPPAIESVYPKAQVQLCIVHMVRASLNYEIWKDRKQAVTDLKPIYPAPTAEEAERCALRKIIKTRGAFPPGKLP